MSKKSEFQNRFTKYLIPCALVTFMVWTASSAYMHTDSRGQELGSEATGSVFMSDLSLPNPYNPELKDIFFDRDSYEIRGDAKPVLDENAEVLKNEPDMFVVIESYCDSREHSPSHLGIKRGDSVKEYILGRSVDAEQVLTVNKCSVYDMKLARSDEAARLDSRAHFVALDQSTDRDSLALAGGRGN